MGVCTRSVSARGSHRLLQRVRHIAAVVRVRSSRKRHESLQLPCRNFAAAIAATSAGGEVVAIDSGGYGTVNIFKSIALVAPTGVHAAITALLTGSSAIFVDASSGDAVTIRH